jgi:hypothetical protein
MLNDEGKAKCQEMINTINNEVINNLTRILGIVKDEATIARINGYIMKLRNGNIGLGEYSDAEDLIQKWDNLD